MLVKQFNIDVNLTDLPFIKTDIRVNQGDTRSVIFNFRVFDGVNEIDYNLVKRAVIFFAKPDKTIVQQNLDFLHSGFSCMLSRNTLASMGAVTAGVSLYGADDERVVSFNFMFWVLKDIMSEFIESSTEFDALAFAITLLERARELYENFPQLKVLGSFDSIEELKNAFPDGSSLGGGFFVSVGDEVHYFYWDILNNDWADAGSIRGQKGDKGGTGKRGIPGKAATINIGTVLTGEPGTPASINNSGTEDEAVFDFVIPRGLPGSGSGGVSSINDSIENIEVRTWVEYLQLKAQAEIDLVFRDLFQKTVYNIYDSHDDQITNVSSGIYLGDKLVADVSKDIDTTQFIKTNEKGSPGGVAYLDASGKVPYAQLPPLNRDLIHIGNFNALTFASGLTTEGMAELGTQNSYVILTDDNEPITGYGASQNGFHLVTTAGVFAGLELNVGDRLVADTNGWAGITVVSIDGVLRSEFVKPNLLVNSDFTNPINTRGQMIYASTGTIETINQWFMPGSTAQMEIVDSGIKITNIGQQNPIGGSFLWQFINPNIMNNILGKTITLSVLSDRGLQTSTLTIPESLQSPTGSNWWIEEQGSVIALHVYVNGRVRLSLRNPIVGNIGESIIFKRAKLERGTVSTILNDPPLDYNVNFLRTTGLMPTQVGKQILINSDFRGANVDPALSTVVNQRRQNSYTENAGHTVIGVDMFEVHAGTLEILNGRLRFTPTMVGTVNGAIITKIEHSFLYYGKTLTASIVMGNEVRVLTITIPSQIPSVAWWSPVTNLGNFNLHLMLGVNGVIQLRVTSQTNNAQPIEFSILKLEEGGISTILNEPSQDLGTELIKCYRFQRVVSGVSFVGQVGFGSTSFAMPVFFQVPFRINPVLSNWRVLLARIGGVDVPVSNLSMSLAFVSGSEVGTFADVVLTAPQGTFVAFTQGVVRVDMTLSALL